MAEAYEVCVEIFEITEDRGDVLIVVGPAAADGGFGVNVDTFEEDSLSIEKNAGAVDTDVAEADVIGEFVGSGRKADLVELRRFRGPEGESGGFDGEGGVAVCVRFGVCFGACFGDVDCHGRSSRSTENVDVAGKLGVGWLPGGAVGEVYVVVVNEGCGNSDERNIAGEAAVVVPVVADRGDPVQETCSVNADDDEVGTGMEDSSEFAIEGREAAFVIANAGLVDPDMRTVVSCTDVQEGSGSGRGLGFEIALVENDALVIKKLRDLRVPVAGDFDGRGRSEVVLVVVRPACDVGVGVASVAAIVDGSAAGVHGAEGGLVDEVVPVAVEACDGAAVDADEECLQGLLGDDREQKTCAEACSAKTRQEVNERQVFLYSDHR